MPRDHVRSTSTSLANSRKMSVAAKCFSIRCEFVQALRRDAGIKLQKTEKFISIYGRLILKRWTCVRAHVPI